MKSRSQRILAQLQAYESRNITFIDPAGTWPIVWEKAQGTEVHDADGKKYLDLTAAFGVAATGHANPRIVRAGQTQMAHLLHAMGDVHPHALKAALARELSNLTFERWTLAGPAARAFSAKTIFGNSGFEAVEAALKTALLATQRPGVVAFNGAYHGLGYGALATTHREHFRSPFRQQLREFAEFVPFPGRASELKSLEATLRKLLRQKPIGAILVEPIQVRGGIHLPPAGFLPLLRRLCNGTDTLLVLDEIYTGFGRTGRWFACEHTETIPDLICLGKALTGGFPLSACVGRATLMDHAWPLSSGEAIHTSTYLGHPVGCAMALAQIKELKSRQLIPRSARLGAQLLAHLKKELKHSPLRLQIRGMGLLAGIEVRHSDGRPASALVLHALADLLHRGFILLPEGEFSNVLSLTPPLTISENQLARAVRALAESLAAAQG